MHNACYLLCIYFCQLAIIKHHEVRLCGANRAWWCLSRCWDKGEAFLWKMKSKKKKKRWWERVTARITPVGKKVEPALPGADRELIQRATSPLCCNRALMFIHFGIMAKRSTEVCLQKFPNSHNGMRAKDTIIIQGGSQVQALRGLLI